MLFGQGELLAGPLVSALFPDILSGRDVLWFIDNTAAASALIKSGSPCEDNSEMALVTALALAFLQARTWYEYVASVQNTSDGLSRGGYNDPLVQQRLRAGEWEALDPQINWLQLLRWRVDEIVRLAAALG